MFTLAAFIRSDKYSDGIVFSMPRRTTHGLQASPFHQPDPSTYMLGLPRSRPRLGKWTLFVFFAGVLIALMLVKITDWLSKF